jgi:CubicO group peptidase (beta-lactamase class C family)
VKSRNLAAVAIMATLAPGEIQAQDVRRSVTRLDGRTLSPGQVERTVERLMAAGRVPGLALAILNRGEIVYLRGFGVAQAEPVVPLGDTTVMYAASFTKSMFAHLVMQLVQEKRIDLDRPIGEYLPKPLTSYEKYADLQRDERWRRFTPRMLLSHTSGLPNWRFTRPGERLDIMFEPGERYSYSGEGINLLQLVVEEATGRELGDLMRERVFEPMRMTRTSTTWQPAFDGEHAVGFDETGSNLGYRKRSSARAPVRRPPRSAMSHGSYRPCFEAKALPARPGTRCCGRRSGFVRPTSSRSRPPTRPLVTMGSGFPTDWGGASSGHRTARPISRKGTTTAGRIT